MQEKRAQDRLLSKGPTRAYAQICAKCKKEPAEVQPNRN